MNRVEEVKAAIKGLSVSDRSDLLVYMLRLKYYATIEEIGRLVQNQTIPLNQDVDSLSYDELLEQLHLLEGIQAGLEDVKQGRVIAHSELKKRFAQRARR